MDTSILHNRIKEYKEKAKNATSKEMILLFESWFLAIENYISDIEMDYFESQIKITDLKNTISLLCDMLILTGHSDKIELVKNNDPDTEKAIQLLLKNKDRLNHNAIIAVSALIKLFPQATNLNQLKEYASGQ